MKGLREKLRADLSLVSAVRIAAGDWAAEDERAAASAIRTALESDDLALVLSWAGWLSSLATRDVFDAAQSVTVGAMGKVTKPACLDCLHFRRPGRSDGACGGRDDLAALYGANHPLRVLPRDGGLSCVRFIRKDVDTGETVQTSARSVLRRSHV